MRLGFLISPGNPTGGCPRSHRGRPAL